MIQMNKKWNRFFKNAGCILMICSLSVSNVSGVWATSVSKTEKEKKEAEKNLDSAKQKVDELAKDKTKASNQVAAMNSDLSDLLGIIQVLENDINRKQEEITQAEEDLAAAKAQEESQYLSMKKRIKYIYEAGDTQYLDVLLQAKSMADLMNKTEYIKELYEYDKNMLDVFQETKDEVADLKVGLEEEQAEMEVIELEYMGQKANLETMIAKKKKEVNDFDTQLVQAKKTADAYTKAVEDQTAKLKKLKEEETKKRAAEEARRKADAAAAAAARQNPGKKGSTTGYVGSGPGAKSTGGTAQGRAIADYGLTFVGNPYVYGGTSLTNGTDCSGFTQGVYKKFGISLPRTSSEQARWGTAVDLSDIQPGDLVCYAGHVGISIGGGQIVHASSAKTGIKVSPVTYRTILAVRRP